MTASDDAAARGFRDRAAGAEEYRWVYLWHWPLLVAATAAWGDLSVPRGVLVATASLVPASATM